MMVDARTTGSAQAMACEAEAEWRRTRAQRAEARAAAVTAQVDLARLTGDLSLDWLTQNVENER